MRRLFALLSSSVLIATAQAGVDLSAQGDTTIQGDEVTINATADTIPVLLVATMSSKGISVITLEIDGRKIAIPRAEFSDLTEPQIKSLQVLYAYPRRKVGDNRPVAPSIFFQLSYGPPQFNGAKLEYRVASFHVANGEYAYRRTRELVARDTWQHYKKPLGLPPEQAGTESVVR